MEDKFIFNYKNSNNIKYVKYSDEYIKRVFSTKDFKITNKYLSFLNKLSYLWEDEKYIKDYMITPLKNLLFKVEYQNKPTSEHSAMFFNMTQPYLIDNFYRLTNHHNIIKTIFGDTGSGKSFLTINENYLTTKFLREVAGFDCSYTKKNICFSREEILNLVPNLKKGETAHSDEDNEGVLGVGSFSSKDFVSRFEKTLRSMSKNFYNCNPDINSHNEHYILKSLGFNSALETNKFIFRERDSIFYGFGVMPSFNKEVKYRKLIRDYHLKKAKFQKSLETQRGDDSRTQRLLNMAVSIIKKYKVNIKMKAIFKLLINNEYKLSVTDATQLSNLMFSLLDSRLNMFPDFKKKIQEFIIIKGEKKK